MPGGLASSLDGERRQERRTRTVVRRVTITLRITGIRDPDRGRQGHLCRDWAPDRIEAISGGVLSKYINLLVLSSALNHPLTRKYTPNTGG